MYIDEYKKLWEEFVDFIKRCTDNTSSILLKVPWEEITEEFSSYMKRISEGYKDLNDYLPVDNPIKNFISKGYTPYDIIPGIIKKSTGIVYDAIEVLEFLKGLHVDYPEKEKPSDKKEGSKKSKK